MNDAGTVIAAGHDFGPYVIDEELGTGGMASVWRARRRDHQPAYPVVLKTMLPHISKQPRFVAMFIREAVLGAELTHPNLINVFDVGLVDERYYIEMEYVAGRTIRQVLRQAAKAKRTFPLSVALAVMADCCDALAYIHDYRDIEGRLLKLVHRDVSPENLMIGHDGVTKLLDFGIATAEHSMLTVTGERKGKMHYMPPEVFRSAPASKSRDIYAVGATLYELVAGRRPFTGANEAELMFQIAEGPLMPPRQIRPELPSELDRLIVDALSRDPADRSADAAAFGRQLRSILASFDRRAPATIVAEAMEQLFSVDRRSESNKPEPRTDDGLATIDPEELVVIDEPVVTVENSVAQSNTADVFFSVPRVRPSFDGELLSDVFTKSSLPRDTDERTSSIFALYGRTARRSVGSTPTGSEPRRARSLRDERELRSVREMRDRLDDREPMPSDDESNDETKRHALVHFERGLEHKRSGRLTSALAEWELAAELDPDNRTIATNVRILRRRME